MGLSPSPRTTLVHGLLGTIDRSVSDCRCSTDSTQAPGFSHGVSGRPRTSLVSTSPPTVRNRASADSLTLQVLVAGTGRGDHDAFERLYRLASPKLFGLCLHLLRRESLAEEALQEAFTQIWRDAGRFDPARGDPFVWMAGITRNRAVDILRRHADAMQRAPRFDADNPQTPGPSEHPQDYPSHDPLTTLIHCENAATLHRCLGELTLEQRQSIALAFFHEMTHPELSLALDVPLGTVKSWVRRGLIALKRCVGR